MYDSHFTLIILFFAPRYYSGLLFKYEGNSRKCNNYKVVFPYSKDKKKQYLPFNKFYFRILEFYSYGNDSPEIVLSPKEVIFMCLWSVYRKEN